MHTNIKQTIETITDTLGGYERIRCPHCPLQLRFRGCSDSEATRLRAHMHDHISRHTA